MPAGCKQNQAGAVLKIMVKVAPPPGVSDRIQVGMHAFWGQHPFFTF